MLNESIKPPTTTNNSLTPELNYYGTKKKFFSRSRLKQSSHILTHKKVVNIYIVYELAGSSSHDSDPTIKKCLFGAVTLTKNADIEKYKNILVMELGLIEDQVFHFLAVGFVQVH